MNNLKRSLALVLSVIMLVGIMAIGAGAAFKDEASITYKDAVNTLVNLGVLTGDENGFRPTDKITRAEVAAIIYRFMNGGDSLSGTPANSRFSDVDAKEWYAIYVEYCATQGIVSGNGDGTFAPNANIDGYAVLKMVLTALGYNAEKEGFVGETWDSATLIKANNLKLLKGLKAGFDASKEITREEVAQIVYNALNKDVVKFLNVFNMYSHEFSGQRDNSTALEEYFDAYKVTGVVFANDAGILGDVDALSENYAGYTFVGTDYDEQSMAYKVATGFDVLGQEVEFYCIDAKNVYGEVVLTDKNTVAENNGKGMTETELTKFLKDNGLKLDENTEYIYYYEGEVTTTDACNSLYNGEEARFIDNDGDGIVDIIISFDKSYFTVGTIGKADKNGVVTYTGIKFNADGEALQATSKNTDTVVAKDQVVSAYYFNGKFNVEIIDPIVGKITSKNTVKDTIVLDGKTYGRHGEADDSLIDNMDTEYYTKDKAYYIDNGYLVMVKALEEAKAETTYAIVLDTGYIAGSTAIGSSKDNVYQAKLLYMDGKQEIVEVSANVDDVKGEIVSYTINKEGKYVLTKVSSDITAAIKKGTAKIDKDTVANNKTLFIVQGGTEKAPTYAFYTGYANVPSMASQDLKVVYKEDSSVATIVFAAKDDAATTKATFFVTSDVETQQYDATNKCTYYTISAIVDGKETEIKYLGSGDFKIGYYTNIVVDKDGYIANDHYVAAVASGLDAETIADGVVKVDDDYLTYSDSTVVYMIDTTNNYAVSTVAVDDIDVENFGTDAADEFHVIMVKNSTTAIATIYWIVK